MYVTKRDRNIKNRIQETFLLPILHLKQQSVVKQQLKRNHCHLYKKTQHKNLHPEAGRVWKRDNQVSTVEQKVVYIAQPQLHHKKPIAQQALVGLFIKEKQRKE